MRNKENGKRTQKKTRRQRSRLSANVTREVTENACHLIQVISVKKLTKLFSFLQLFFCLSRERLFFLIELLSVQFLFLNCDSFNYIIFLDSL